MDTLTPEEVQILKKITAFNLTMLQFLKNKQDISQEALDGMERMNLEAGVILGMDGSEVTQFFTQLK